MSPNFVSKFEWSSCSPWKIPDKHSPNESCSKHFCLVPVFILIMLPEAAPDGFIFLHFTLPGSYSEVRSAALTGDLKANVGYFSRSSLFTTRTAIQCGHKQTRSVSYRLRGCETL